MNRTDGPIICGQQVKWSEVQAWRALLNGDDERLAMAVHKAEYMHKRDPVRNVRSLFARGLATAARKGEVIGFLRMPQYLKWEISHRAECLREWEDKVNAARVVPPPRQQMRGLVSNVVSQMTGGRM